MAMKVEHKIKLLEALDVFKALGIAILLIFAVQNVHKQNQQIEGATRQIAATKAVVTQLNSLGKARTQQINDLQHHIDCIVILFQQPDRSNLTITNIENCRLTNNNTGGSTVNQPDNTDTQPPRSTPTTSSPPPTNLPLLCTFTFHIAGCE